MSKQENTKISEYEERKNKLDRLNEREIEAYPAKSDRTQLVGNILSDFDNFEKEETIVIVCGRLRSKRVHGNLSFADLEDESGRIQIAVSKKEVGDNYKPFAKLIDAGDFVQITGTVFTTKAGQKTVMATEWKLLTKALRGLPVEHFGLKDEDEKFRKRYIDLVLNPELREMFKRRAKFWRVMREFMQEKDFFEVETPSIEVTTGGAEARPFATHHNDFDMPVFMRISIGELWQKRLMASGFEKTFEIGRAFRNEGSSPNHVQEFTNMEFYWAYADYQKGMDMVVDLYRHIAKEVYGTTKFKARGLEFDLADEWTKIDYVEEVQKQTGVNVLTASEKDLAQKLDELEVKYEGDNRERRTDALWKYCRKNIAGPAFLINHPVFMAPLAKRKSDNPQQSEKFQVLLGGAEVGAGYSELNDPIDQKERFGEQKELLESGDDEAMMPDWEFVEMLEYGMPPTCGFGVGERLFAFLEDKTLREVTLFPLMKPKGAEDDKIISKNKDTKIAVAIINKGSKMEAWQEMNTVSHLSASFASRDGKTLLEQNEIITKDQEKIKLNIQHAIIIKEANNNQELINLIKDVKNKDVKVVEFTRDMIETSDDSKLIKIASEKNFNEFEYLGVLVFGKKSLVEKNTKKFELYK